MPGHAKALQAPPPRERRRPPATVAPHPPHRGRLGRGVEMPVTATIAGISSPDVLRQALEGAQYLANEGLATAAYLALALGKPLLLEGAPGVGKTEAAKAIGAILARQVIRLQCYEGIDQAAALYEWNYPRQMLAIRQAGEGFRQCLWRRIPSCATVATSLARAGKLRPVNRRDRPSGSRVRGISPGVPIGLHDLDPGNRDRAGAHPSSGRPYLEPHPRSATRRCAGAVSITGSTTLRQNWRRGSSWHGPRPWPRRPQQPSWPR